MVKPLVNNYGMIIVDECHHDSAESFECVLKAIHAKYVYGLTATPKRSDGHQPIIFMQCGAIRYSADAKADNTYAEKMHRMLAAHDIEHYIKNKTQSSFVAIDGKTVWYASGELFGTTEDECVLRIEDEVLAGELAHNIHDFKMLCF